MPVVHAVKGRQLMRAQASVFAWKDTRIEGSTEKQMERNNSKYRALVDLDLFFIQTKIS